MHIHVGGAGGSAVNGRSSWWRPAVMLLAAVYSLSILDSAGASSDTTRGQVSGEADDPVSPSSASPAWPFAGVVGLNAGFEDGHFEVNYWHVETGEVTTLESSWNRGRYALCPPNRLYAGTEGVVAEAGLLTLGKIPLPDGRGFDEDYADIVLLVPWSDSAYPSYVVPGYSKAEHKRLLDQGGFGMGMFSIDRWNSEFELWQAERFQLHLGDRERIYSVQEFDLPDGVDDERLYWPYLSVVSGEDEVIERLEGLGALRFLENPGFFGAGPRVVGTDGRHYLIQWTFGEPACPDVWVFVVDGPSGEIAACGSRYGGFGLPDAFGHPVTVVSSEPDAVIPAGWSLPRPVTPRECSQRTLGEFLR